MTKVKMLETGTQEYYEAKFLLKKLTRSLYDFQQLKNQSARRVGKKADDTWQRPNGTVVTLTESAKATLDELNTDMKGTEKAFNDKLTSLVKRFPEWQLWLKDVKGCGPLMAAVLITEIDIEKAVNASKIKQFAGLNPGLVPGKKLKGKEIVETGEMIRGDRPTAGFLRPYNAFLKTKVLGVLATCFIKSQSEYTKVYYDTKTRLKNSDKPVNGNAEKLWKDESDAHIHNAAVRKMMAIFLQDYYDKVRKIWNLEVRCPYSEEYLGQMHNDPKWAQ